jgi:hypothetical protein
MNKFTTGNEGSKATYSERGTGRLYKRGSNGTEYPAGDPHAGNYYLEYRVNGKRTRQRLLHPDTGGPITKQADAETERARITAPFTTSHKAEQLQAIKAKLEAADRKYAEAVEKANPPPLLADPEPFRGKQPMYFTPLNEACDIQPKKRINQTFIP